MQATFMRQGRSMIFIGRLLALICGVLLLAIAIGCRNQDVPETAGHAIGDGTEMARAAMDGPLDESGRELDGAVEEPEDAIEYPSHKADQE